MAKSYGRHRDDFINYARTPHLFGSKGTDEDKQLGRKEFDLGQEF